MPTTLVADMQAAQSCRITETPTRDIEQEACDSSRAISSPSLHEAE